MSVIPQTLRASGGFVPLGPLKGLCPGPAGLIGPQTPRLLTPPLTTNPGSAPGPCSISVTRRVTCIPTPRDKQRKRSFQVYIERTTQKKIAVTFIQRDRSCSKNLNTMNNTN